MMLDNSSVGPCRRTVTQSDYLLEMFSYIPVRGCTTNGHPSGVSTNEATPTVIVKSTEMCTYGDSDWSRPNPNRALEPGRRARKTAPI